MEKYSTPDVEIIEFEAEAVIISSQRDELEQA